MGLAGARDKRESNKPWTTKHNYHNRVEYYNILYETVRNGWRYLSKRTDYQALCD